MIYSSYDRNNPDCTAGLGAGLSADRRDAGPAGTMSAFSPIESAACRDAARRASAL
jgi:hypothetical protein